MLRSSVAMLSLLTAACTASGAPVIINLGQLTNTSGPCGTPTPNALSTDGGTVVGDGVCGSFRWDNVQGLQNTGALIPGAFALSSDASVTVGYDLLGPGGRARAVRLLPGNVLHYLGVLAGHDASESKACSADGSKVAGISYVYPGQNIRAIRWDSVFGFQALAMLPNALESRATCMSADGATIFGYSWIGNTYVGTRWINNAAPQALPLLPNTAVLVPLAVEDNGTICVGYTQSQFSGYLLALRWTPGGGTEELTPPPLAVGALAAEATPGGLAVVGHIIFGPSNSNSHAAVWTETYGWTDLNNLLPALGVNLTGWTLTTCSGISDDGTVLIGQGYTTSGPVAWLVRGIPPLCGPRIDIQPVNTTKCAHATATITSIALAPSQLMLLSRQWYKRVPQGTGYADIFLNDVPTPYGSSFSGTHTGNLSISNLSPADAGVYFCRFAGGCGTVDTQLITLTVLPNISGNGGPIGTADLVIVLGNFGQNVPPFTNGDVNGDGIVNTADLTTVLGLFGEQCP